MPIPRTWAHNLGRRMQPSEGVSINMGKDWGWQKGKIYSNSPPSARTPLTTPMSAGAVLLVDGFSHCVARYAICRADISSFHHLHHRHAPPLVSFLLELGWPTLLCKCIDGSQPAVAKDLYSGQRGQRKCTSARIPYFIPTLGGAPLSLPQSPPLRPSPYRPEHPHAAAAALANVTAGRRP
jgi:hypothetical protein